MRALTLLFSLVLLVRTAWAGGYQGALERLWVFYAYNIDQELDEGSRTLGYRCVNDAGKTAWDKSTKQCKGNWVSCQSVMKKEARCNFNELMEFLGKYQKKWNSVPGNDPSTRTPPVEDTAKAYWNKVAIKQNTAISNYPPEAFFKATNGEYQHMVDQIGARTVSAGPALKSRFPDLFEGFAVSSDKIAEARVGDHGPFLVDGFRKWLQDNGITGLTVEQENVGSGRSPVTTPGDPKKGTSDSVKPWYTLNVEQVLQKSSYGVSQTIVHMDNFFKFFYNGKKSDEHRQVIRGFQGLATRVRTCG